MRVKIISNSETSDESVLQWLKGQSLGGKLFGI